jgi:DNA-binding GntR family transcriptional regulator
LNESGLVPVTSLTRREAVLRHLRRAILVGDLAPGQRLKEVQLAQSLGVSRPTLREAIYQLIHDGLLVQEDYKGIRVARLDAGSVEDLALVRIELETLAAKAVASDKTGRRKRMLSDAFDKYVEAGRREDPVEEQEAHMALHRTIWFASENTVIQRMWTIVEGGINLATTTDLAARAGSERSRIEHRRLVEAILHGNRRTIAAEVKRHVWDNAVLIKEISSHIADDDDT